MDSAGVDGKKTGEQRKYFLEHPGKLIDKVRKGEHRPLETPTMIDRIVQQAVTRVLSREYEKVF